MPVDTFYCMHVSKAMQVHWAVLIWYYDCVIVCVNTFLRKHKALALFVIIRFRLSQMVQSDWLLRGPLPHLETSAEVFYRGPLYVLAYGNLC